MRKYKLIASDLDGTLLKKDMTISKENINAIRSISQRGIYFALSTGRTLAEIPQDLKNIADVRYIIHSNGAVIYDTKTKKRDTMCIGGQLYRRILELLSKYETLMTVRYNGVSYINGQLCNDEKFAYYNVSPYFQAFIQTTNVYQNSFYDFCAPLDEIEVVSAYFREKRDFAECKRLLESTGELQVVSPEPYLMEVFSKNAGKGKALGRLAKMLNIAIEDTIAIGDSDNDRTIIEVAGCGLVVANGSQELKNIADDIICSNEEHVVEYVLKHYV